jgi:hypothetical protein
MNKVLQNSLNPRTGQRANEKDKLMNEGRKSDTFVDLLSGDARMKMH